MEAPSEEIADARRQEGLSKFIQRPVFGRSPMHFLFSQRTPAAPAHTVSSRRWDTFPAFSRNFPDPFRVYLRKQIYSGPLPAARFAPWAGFSRTFFGIFIES